MFRLEFSAGVGDVAPTMAESDDEALILHTSGTTSRPKDSPTTDCQGACSARDTFERDRTCARSGGGRMMAAVSGRCGGILVVIQNRSSMSC